MNTPQGLEEDDSTSEFIDRLVEAVYTGSKEFAEQDSEQLLEECGIAPTAGGWHPAFVAQCSVDTVYLDPGEAWEHLDGLVTPERLEALQQGEDPTPEETKLYREKLVDSRLDFASGENVILYQVTDTKGRSIYFTVSHGDGGDVLGCDGPYQEVPPEADWVEGDTELPDSDYFSISGGWSWL